jgi:flagellar basal body-associated protein FliL
MDDSDLEPDPKHRVPTILWLMLGLLLVVLFAAAVIILGGHFPARAVGPPAGAP